jgi:hypothetical protein
VGVRHEMQHPVVQKKSSGITHAMYLVSVSGCNVVMVDERLSGSARSRSPTHLSWSCREWK